MILSFGLVIKIHEFDKIIISFYIVLCKFDIKYGYETIPKIPYTEKNYGNYYAGTGID